VATLYTSKCEGVLDYTYPHQAVMKYSLCECCTDRQKWANSGKLLGKWVWA